MSGRKLPSRSENETPAAERAARGSWCAVVGIAGLLFWLVGGGILEGFHGFKAAMYLQDPLRREMWTLAHAHGTMLSLACLVLALWLAKKDVGHADRLKRLRRADRLFAAGAVLLPLGFLFGGMRHYESDPGPGILLVPLGGLLAASALVLVISSRELREGPSPSSPRA
jgi:hypothetical protein